MESLLELRDLVFTRSFIPMAVVLGLVAVVGSGLWKIRWRRLAFLAALLAVTGIFVVGIMPHAERGQEWTEVLFNGQLL